MLVVKNIIIPENFIKTYDFYPIEEWKSLRDQEICGKKITIVFGIDWMGVRYCSDKSYYVLIQ